MGYIHNILLYADDIVCLAENVADLQDIIGIIENWCIKWRLEVKPKRNRTIWPKFRLTRSFGSG